MDAVERLRSRNRFQQTLPSGLEVTLRLPRLRDCVIAGRIPYPIIEYVRAKAQGNGAPKLELSDEMKMEDAAATARYQDAIVRLSIVEIEGEPVELSPEDVKDLLPEDYAQILAFGSRETPFPKDPTRGNLESSPPQMQDESSLGSSSNGDETLPPSSSPSMMSSPTISEERSS